LAERDVTGLTSRKVRDRAIALVLVGFALFMPPLASLSTIDIKIDGIPFTVVFLFLVWLLLIAGAMALARPLLNSDESMAPDRRTDKRT